MKRPILMIVAVGVALLGIEGGSVGAGGQARPLGPGLARELSLTPQPADGSVLCDGYLIEVEEGEGYCVSEEDVSGLAEAMELACRLRGEEPDELDSDLFVRIQESSRLSNGPDSPKTEARLLELHGEIRGLLDRDAGTCLNPART
jgi:hypothetical protein